MRGDAARGLHSLKFLVAPGRTALLLTGFQNDFCHPLGALGTGGRELGSVREAVPAALRLLEEARRAGVAVVHVAEVTLSDGLSDSEAWARRRRGAGGPGLAAVQGSWGHRFLEGFDPHPEELVVNRYRPTSLSDTRTEVLLRSNGVRTLIVAGVETHATVLATAIDGACRDYVVVVPPDCVAGTLPELHRAAMAVLPAWAELVDSREILQAWSA